MSDQKKDAKNPIVKLVQHFIMDPIKTPTEADARIKEILPFLGGFFGGVILFILLGNWIPPVKTLFNIVGYICMAGVFAFGFFLFRAVKAKSHLKKLQCNNCKEVITYGDNISIASEKISISVNVEKKELSNKKIRVQATAREYAYLEVLCKCQKCGTEKTLRENFRLRSAETNSEDHVNSIELGLAAERLRAQMQECVDNNFENADRLNIHVSARKTPSVALYEFFSDDCAANNTPIGTFTRTK